MTEVRVRAVTLEAAITVAEEEASTVRVEAWEVVASTETSLAT